MPKRKLPVADGPVLEDSGEDADYNDVRSANIRRNEEFLRAIGIDDVIAPISSVFHRIIL